jgi:malonyl-CoA O-methyltransferase
VISTDKVKKAFAKSAKNYSKHSSLQNDVSKILLEDYAPSQVAGKILDVGCGAGFTALTAMAKWPGAEITAVDVARGMAVETRRNGIKNVVTGDAASLPFKQNTFNGVISSLAFQWIVREDADFFKRLSSVIQGGGFLSFSMMAEGTLAELRKAYGEACLECTGREATFPKFPDASFTAKLIRGAGFVVEKADYRLIKRGYKNADELFTALKGLGAAAPARPANAPRRDILKKTRELYPSHGGLITASYNVAYFACHKPIGENEK